MEDAPRQKRLALVNDLTGFGRCSLAAQMPVVSALGVQGCPMPTALLPVHSGFPESFSEDCTALLDPWAACWAKTGVRFDAVLTGWLGSPAQADAVAAFLRAARGAGALAAVDPVMGDHGRLYGPFTSELCDRLASLLPLAELLTPNLTEACRLLGRPWPEGGVADDAALADMAEALDALGPSRVVITGVADASGATLRNYVHERGRPDAVVRVDRLGGDRSGAGDVFAAVLVALLVRGEALEPAVRRAAAFVSRCTAEAIRLDLPWNWGLPFEPFLGDLAAAAPSSAGEDAP